jgi:hypothetical protein
MAESNFPIGLCRAGWGFGVSPPKWDGGASATFPAGATLLAPWDVIPTAVDARYRDKDGEISRKHDDTSTATGALKSLSVETSIV